MFQQSTAGLVRGAALAGSLALFPFTAACGAGNDTDDKGAPGPVTVTAAPEAGVVAPAKVEVIAGLTGCTAKIRIEADELRQGVCHTEKSDYLITTFPEERHKQAWLEAASVYGGQYLVGSRWVVGARPEALSRFRSRLGGTARQLSATGPTAAPKGA
ncbi:hypothetical protein ABT330_09545 [Streptomyces sp. NPDC000658]|uniref:hypothetical protein n=1 Tax=Streptomyces sp. NPDC000658 TaxID=3154266 RepID=UPI00331A7840